MLGRLYSVDTQTNTIHTTARQVGLAHDASQMIVCMEGSVSTYLDDGPGNFEGRSKRDQRGFGAARAWSRSSAGAYVVASLIVRWLGLLACVVGEVK